MIRSRVKTVRKGKQRTRPSFSIDFFSNPTVKAARGDSPSVNTRATIATVTDWEGVTREVRSGENRFGGMRRVENLINRIAGANSNTLAGGVASGATLTGPDSDGFYTLTRTGAAGTWAHFVFGSGAIGYSMLGRSYTVRAVFKSVGTMTDFRLNVSDVSVTTASSPNLASALSTTPKILSFFTAAAFTNSGQIGAFGITLNGANGESLAFKFVQCEDVTGQSVTTAGEYVSVGVLSSPFQGANVDGVAYFSTLNGNVVI